MLSKSTYMTLKAQQQTSPQMLAIVSREVKWQITEREEIVIEEDTPLNHNVVRPPQEKRKKTLQSMELGSHITP